MKLIKIYLLIISILLIIINPGLANDSQQYSYIVIDYNNGKTISSYKEYDKVLPYSLTNMMTLYILLDKVKNKEISLNDKILISQKAASFKTDKVGLKAGSYILIKDAINFLTTQSANDIAYAIAEHISLNKSENDFVNIMNITAKRLGLKNTNFTSSNGILNTNQYTTTYDIAILARSLSIHYNSYYNLFAQSNYKWSNLTYKIQNFISYDRIDILNIGYTNKDGYYLIISAYKNDSRIISVVTGLESITDLENYVINIIKEGLDLVDKNRTSSIQIFYKPMSILINNSPTLENEIPNKNNNDSNLHDVSYVIYKKDKEIQDKPKVIIDNKLINNLNINSYVIQLGAFKNYKNALDLASRASKISDLENLLTKPSLYIEKKNNLFIVQYRNLYIDNALYACNIIINKKVSECVIKQESNNKP